MKVLFVHGMGRSPLSGLPMLYELKKEGFDTHSFGYFVTVDSFDVIRTRLQEKIIEIAEEGDYILVGHSLGGVLIRAALNAMDQDIKQPRQVFLLGSPIVPSRLAQRLSSNFLFKGLTQDCGNLLGSESRMSDIGSLDVPTISITGTRQFLLTRPFFNGEVNDGVVSHSETWSDWFEDHINLPFIHSALPSSRKVAKLVIEKTLS